MYSVQFDACWLSLNTNSHSHLSGYLNSMTTRKSVEKTAEGGKTARACDSCISKRARWYCAADDAFLCQARDASVHSANSLAHRHERVRLQTASFRTSSDKSSAASWHQGFTRKPRSPRMGKTALARKPFPQVPEMSAKEETEDHEQLLHRVPELGVDSDVGNLASVVGEKENSNAYLLYDMDPAEFAADVESLLGNSLDNDCFDMEELGLATSKEDSMTKDDFSFNSCKVIKIEQDEIDEFTPTMLGTEADTMRQPFELNFMDFSSNPMSCGEEEKLMVEVMGVMKNGELEMEETKIVKNKKKVSLSLDSEAVIIAWGSRGTPWTFGDRPNLDLNYYWPDYMGMCESEYHYQVYGEFSGGICRQAAAAGVEGEREARVSRYRQKRRTRLFAKKIRYEVRKLNAEKRPRMKGRFVKRSSCFAPPPLPLFN